MSEDNAAATHSIRELEGRIALVMGAAWRWFYAPEPKRIITFDDRYGLATGNEVDAGVGFDVPSYLSSITAAWAVVEKMRADEWSLRLDISGRRDEVYAEFVRWHDGRKHEISWVDDTMPRAVCLAALVAMEARA